jgi:hypothetical protein
MHRLETNFAFLRMLRPTATFKEFWDERFAQMSNDQVLEYFNVTLPKTVKQNDPEDPKVFVARRGQIYTLGAIALELNARSDGTLTKQLRQQGADRQDSSASGPS